MVQVDVRALKQALWGSLQDLRAKDPESAELDFQVGCLCNSWMHSHWLCTQAPEALRKIAQFHPTSLSRQALLCGAIQAGEAAEACRRSLGERLWELAQSF